MVFDDGTRVEGVQAEYEHWERRERRRKWIVVMILLAVFGIGFGVRYTWLGMQQPTEVELKLMSRWVLELDRRATRASMRRPSSTKKTDDPSWCGNNRWFLDADNDGFGSAHHERVLVGCLQPQGFVGNGGDCNDTTSNVFPGAIDTPGDGIDQNCDGRDG